MEATVVLQLVKEGKLGLDDKLSDVLPEVAEQDLVERADEITVQQLIRHTSGIPDWFTDGGKFDVFDFTTVLHADRPGEGRPYRAPHGRAGREVRYSNTNYVLLGMIIEKVTGHDRAAEFKRRLFAPLGMKHTYLATKVSDQIKGPHGHGYYPDAKAGRATSTGSTPASGRAEGSISTAHDVSAFYRAFNQGKLLPRGPADDSCRRPFPSLCGGTVAAAAGGVPGISSTTFSSADGRIQFAVAATLKIDNEKAMAVGDAITKAAEAVLCPGR